MGGRAAGFRPAVAGGVGRLSPGSDWETDCPDFGRTALRSPILSHAADTRVELRRVSLLQMLF